MSRCKVAIVGYGGMGGWHAKKLKTIPEIEIAGTYDIREERQEAARADGLSPYASFEALLEDKSVQLVTIATPNEVHAPLAIALMDSGKNVISEKPVTLSSELLETMIAASKRNNKIFSVHQNRRWDEDFRIADKIVNENMLGKVFCVESRVHGSRGIPTDWRSMKKHGGGMVLDWGIHLFDQLMMMTKGQKITNVYAELSYVTSEEVDDGLKVMMTFESGFCALAEIGTNNFVSLPRWYITGENGTAVIENFQLDGKIVMVSDWEKRDAVPVSTAAGITKTMAPRTAETIKEYPLPRVESDVRDYYYNMMDAIEGKAGQIVTHDQIRRTMKLMEAIFLSAQTKQAIHDII
ncbi:MAG: Gfo/Idh/MocA family oxidoreductase [Oscillospiraceae bacterium]|jgi:predicted dehydrogenase|nr:Gfo/Idh/MocA family oxidoreductase [Oscillospiraceae bacterium]